MAEDLLSATRAWIQRETGATKLEVLGQLAGSTTATVHDCVIDERNPIVIKVYDRGIDGVGQADVERDALAMTAAEGAAIAAPRLLCADADGRQTEYPTIVMTRLAGRPLLSGGRDSRTWTHGLARAIADVFHAPQPTTPLPEYEHWYSLPVHTPIWASHPSDWRALNEILATEPPRTQARFMHRDHHALNVLWDRNAVTGTVDWVNGCIGPAEYDVACGRFNVGILSPGDDCIPRADEFLHQCLELGLPWSPHWDLVEIAGLTDIDTLLAANQLGARLTPTGIRESIETLLRSAIERID